MKFQIAWFIFLLSIALQTFLAQQVGAGTEYVYVQKTMDDKAIIVRQNGDAYLIEKGVGCLSLWRFEGKTVLINSPGLFLGVGSELLIPDAQQKCRIWNSEYLGQSKTPSPPSPTSPQQKTPNSDCTEKHWVQSKSDDGSIIILEDGSVWEVDAIGKIYSMLWLPTQGVIVCRGKMINLSDGKTADVIRIK